jgi:hypothetical protein
VVGHGGRNRFFLTSGYYQGQRQYSTAEVGPRKKHGRSRRVEGQK